MGVLTSPRPKKVYACKEQELYTILENGWASYMEHLAVFAGKKSFYTAQKATDALAAKDVAERMPDEAARESRHVLLRKEVVNRAVTCMILWGDLSSFIMDGFPEEDVETYRKAAGHNHYEKAGNEDWEAVRGLMKNGADFIAAHGPELSGGGMLATFPSEFGQARTEFLDKYLEFKQTVELTKTLTDEKIVANNLAYKELMRMFADGRRYFRFHAAIREQFTFERVLALISGTRGGSRPEHSMVMSGTVTDENGNPLHLATVTLSNIDASIAVETDAEGKYSIEISDLDEPLSATLTASAIGKMVSSRPVVLKAKEDQVQDFQLFPMATPPPVP